MEISWSIVKEIIRKRNIFIEAVLGRSACVGLDVLQTKIKNNQGKIRFINVQKGRLDLLLSWLNGAKRPKAKLIKPYIISRGVFGLIKQQESLKWLKIKKAKYLFMDTWSELSDQKFTHKKDGWSFCCSFTDINFKSNFSDIFSCEGWLSDEEIVYYYKTFFEWWRQHYVGKKIIIMFYSPKFDQREKFKERVYRINQLISRVSANYGFVATLELDDNQVFIEPFDYHYSGKTLQAFVDKWSELEKN